MDINCIAVNKMLWKMFNNYKPLVNEVNDMNAQGGQLRNVCITVFFLFYDGCTGQNCCQIKLGNKTMSWKSTHSLLLHDSLIKLFILSMSSVWKKEVNNAFAHQEYDYTCDCTYVLYVPWKTTKNIQGSC